MATSKQMDQAMTLAREYAALRDRGAVNQLQGIRETINTLVARYDGAGRMVLPQSVEAIMGVDAYGTEIGLEQVEAESRKGTRR